MAQFHPLESNSGRSRWEEVTIAVNLDSDHEGVHTYIKFHQNVHYLCIFPFVNQTYFKEKYMCLNYQYNNLVFHTTLESIHTLGKRKINHFPLPSNPVSGCMI